MSGITLFADFLSPASFAVEEMLWRVAEARGLAVRCRAADPAPDDVDEPAIDAAAQALNLPALSRARPASRTDKAHEASAFAATAGMEREMRLAIYRAVWIDGRDVGRIDALVDLASGIGLDAVDLKIALDIDRFRQQVEHDREVARRLNVRRLPVIFLGTGPTAATLTGMIHEADLSAAAERLTT